MFHRSGILIVDHTWLEASSFVPNELRTCCFWAREIEIVLEEPPPLCCCRAIKGICGENPDQSCAMGTARCFVRCLCLPMTFLIWLLKPFYGRCWCRERCTSVKLKLLSDGHPRVQCVTTFFHNKHRCLNQTRSESARLQVCILTPVLHVRKEEDLGKE